MKTFTIFALLVLISACSSNKHLTGDYEKFARSHRSIAVLPYDITIIGKEAKELTPEQLDQVILSESSLFQQSLFAEVLKRTGVRDKDIKISVQDLRKTNTLLLGANIDGINIKDFSASELGKILNVDAVVSTRLIKEGFLNRETALLADIITETAVKTQTVPIDLVLNRRKMVRSSAVDIYAYIIDVDNDAPVWQYNTECDLSWDMEPSEVIENINGRISKKFPYRQK